MKETCKFAAFVNCYDLYVLLLIVVCFHKYVLCTENNSLEDAESGLAIDLKI